MERQQEKSKAIILILGVIIIGIAYQMLHFLPISFSILDPINTVFNAVLTGLLAYYILKDEFTEWYKHFSFKWIIIGIPFILITSMICGAIAKAVSGGHMTQNTVNDILTWKFIATHPPFMLMGEELLSITLLYAAWKKLGWKFWQSSLLCAILFALWHIVSYGYNIPQILITLVAPRLVLNFIFKKSNSIWSSWVVHLVFDTITFVIAMHALH